MFVNSTWQLPGAGPIELPGGLKHIDSDLCWCDPIVERDENGEEIVLHQEVTWH